jgi:predicted PhzF superfamily epimerase YddE/YHI9
VVEVHVVRVFADESGRFGNPLGIVDGAAVAEADRQRVATELGYSETVFVDDAAAGRIRIYTPVHELPFAGHPTVGTAWWLAGQGHVLDALEVPAGTIEVTRDGDLTRVRAHADWVNRFEWHRLAAAEDVEALDPASYPGGPHYVWAWIDEAAGTVRSRNFAPGVGVPEDQATGAAAIGLAVRLRRDLEITQGLGSRLSATYLGDGWATVGGRVVHESTFPLSTGANLSR